MKEIKFKVNSKQLDGSVNVTEVSIDDENNITFDTKNVSGENDNKGENNL